MIFNKELILKSLQEVYFGTLKFIQNFCLFILKISKEVYYETFLDKKGFSFKIGFFRLTYQFVKMIPIIVLLMASFFSQSWTHPDSFGVLFFILVLFYPWVLRIFEDIVFENR